MIYVDVDCETRSTVDIKKSGLAKYARSPETEVLCFVMKSKRGFIGISVNDLNRLRLLAGDEEYIFRAHNAAFEMQILEHKFGIKIPPHRWRCSMALARSYGLPASLGACGAALGLDKQKDEEGRRNMMELCKPMGKNRKWQPHGQAPKLTYMGFNWDDDRYLMDQERYDALVSYCVDDVLSEEAIFEKLGELIPSEQKLWERDYVINYVNGIEIDTELCEKAIELFDVKCEEINRLCKKDHGFTLNQSAKVAEYLGVDNVRKETIRDLQFEACDLRHWVLEARKVVSSTSPKKYQAALNMEVDGYCYGTMMFHGASQTGRWAGRGLQVQNFPRGSFSEDWVDEEMEVSISYLKQGRVDDLDMNWMDTLKSCLRGMITGPISVCDYSSIESRVLAWMAGEEKKLDAFREGKDMYKVIASQMYGIEYDKVTKEQRQMGKIGELACGFQGGYRAYTGMAEVYGLDLEEDDAKDIVKKWRKANPSVVRLWYSYEEDAINAITSGEKHGCFEVIGDFLHLHLPSGRSIKYYKPKLVRDEKFDKMSVTFVAEPSLSDKVIKKLGKGLARIASYGGKFVQNATQAIARDLIADAVMKLPEHAVNLLVHDEICSQSVGLQEIEQAMLDTPHWAKGLPVAVDGFEAPRYRK